MSRYAERDAGNLLTRRLLRGGALVVALLAVIDPALPRDRASRPLVTLSVAPGTPASLVSRVREALAGADVVDGVAGGDAAVVVGAPAAATLAAIDGPAIVILPDSGESGVVIDGVESPRSVALGESAELTVRVRARGTAGDSVVVRLREGAVVVAREAVAATAGRHIVRLGYVPTAPGLAGVRVEAAIVDATGSERVGSTESVDAGVVVSSERRRILMHEPVPSWRATFVRRALEADPRLQTESRTATSRGISTGAGAAPTNLADPAALTRFDAVVVSDASALTVGEVAALERYVSGGGSAVLLLDGPGAGAAGRLIGAGWRVREYGRPVPLVMPGAADTAAMLRSASLVAPAGARPGLVPMLVANGGGPAEATPAVWRLALGAGTVVVSGATDDWRHRDRTSSSFVSFWPNTVVAMAQWSRDVYGVTLEHDVSAPGAAVAASVRFRPSSSAGVADAELTGWIEPVDSLIGGPSGRGPVRVWPGSSPLEATVLFTTPARPGHYRLVVERRAAMVDSARAEAEFLVAEGAVPAGSFGGFVDTRLSASVVSARGGRMLGDGELRALPSALTETVRPPVRQVPWHPMRSAWWIVPFALLLAAEWYLRRRAALP